MAGKQVTCQVCGRFLIAPKLETSAGIERPFGSPAQNMPFTQQTEFKPPASPATAVCPACGEDIPAKASVCPYCNESLANAISKDELAEKLQFVLADLDDHISDPAAQAEDRRIRGGHYSAKTIVAGVLTALALLFAVGGGLAEKRIDVGMIILMSVFCAFIPGICLIVSLVNDAKANHILDAKSPEKAFRNFLFAIKSGRAAKAFVALPPSARTMGAAKTIQFNNAGIPSHNDAFFIRDLPSFKAYWKSIFSGPTLQTRGVQIKGSTRSMIGTDLAVVETEFAITNYPSLAMLSIFLCGPIPTMIIILILQKKEKQNIKKLMIRRKGNWYVADGQLRGQLDNISN